MADKDNHVKVLEKRGDLLGRSRWKSISIHCCSLRCSGWREHPLTKDLEKNSTGDLLIDRVGSVFQFFTTVSICQATLLLPYLDWPSAKWLWSTALSQPDFGRGGEWHSWAGVTGAQSWALSAGESMAQGDSPPLSEEFTHLLRNINWKSKADGMGQAGNGGGSGLVSGRMERLSGGPLSSEPDVCNALTPRYKSPWNSSNQWRDFGS